MRDGFRVPDFDAAPDVETHVQLVPAGATVKGMLLQSTLDHLQSIGTAAPDRFGPYFGFKDYAGEEFVRLLGAAGDRAEPGKGLGHGLRALGKLAYPAIRDTLIGRTIFSIFSSNIERLIPLASRAYGMSASVGGAEVLELGDGEAVIRLTDIYTFLEHYHFGIFEGVLAACELEGEVMFAPDDNPTTGRFWIRWTK